MPLLEIDEENNHECAILSSLIDSFFQTHAVDEVEPLVVRLQEKAKEESSKRAPGNVHYAEFYVPICSARLHEVLHI